MPTKMKTVINDDADSLRKTDEHDDEDKDDDKGC